MLPASYKKKARANPDISVRHLCQGQLLAIVCMRGHSVRRNLQLLLCLGRQSVHMASAVGHPDFTKEILRPVTVEDDLAVLDRLKRLIRHIHHLALLGTPDDGKEVGRMIHLEGVNARLEVLLIGLKGERYVDSHRRGLG